MVVVGAAVVVVLVVVVVVLQTKPPGMQIVVHTGVITPSTHEIEVTTSIDRIAPPEVELESVT